LNIGERQDERIRAFHSGLSRALHRYISNSLPLPRQNQVTIHMPCNRVGEDKLKGKRPLAGEVNQKGFSSFLILPSASKPTELLRVIAPEPVQFAIRVPDLNRSILLQQRIQTFTKRVH
jgi:hypothetical protein